MNPKVKNFLGHVVRILIINVLLVLATLCTRRCFSSNDWKVGVDIEYQYENEPNMTHTIHYDDKFSYNLSVKWIEPYYTTPAGYTNRLILMTSVKSNQNSMPRYVGAKELMYVPDRKFQVTNLSITTSEMTTYRPFLKKLP